MNIVTSTNILNERNSGAIISVEKSIELCALAGYRELDLCFVDLVTAGTDFCGGNWKEYLLDLLSLAKKKGITFVQAHAPIHDFCREDEPDSTAFRLMKRSVEGAALLGIPWIVVHPSTGVAGGKQTPDTHDRNVDYMGRLSDFAKPLGVGIAAENMWGFTRDGVKRYAIEAEELCRLIDDTGRENLGACWDTEHGSIEGINQPEAVNRLGHRIKATHISDQTASDNIHILPYTGFIDWDNQVLKPLARIGYKGVFAFEIQHYLLRMPDHLLLQAVEFSRAVGEGMIKRIEELKKCNAREIGR